jgi:DNA-binding NarL/FixJ family response regulator
MLSNRARILIADDHNLVAELCKTLLEPEFDVLATVSDGHALLRAAVELKPDVIVLDIAIPFLNGLDAGRQVKEALHAVKLVYLTMNTDPELAVEAFHRGASGYLLKTCAASEMVLAVREVLRGKTYLASTLKEKVDYLRWERKEIVEDANRLTERQREVLLGVTSNAELVRYEVRNRINLLPRLSFRASPIRVSGLPGFLLMRFAGTLGQSR